MANALLDVVNTFTLLDARYAELKLACRTQADRDALDAKWATAQANCEIATKNELEDDDEEVAALSEELQQCNEELSKAESEMGDMSKVLDNLTQALTFGAKLLAMV